MNKHFIPIVTLLCLGQAFLFAADPPEVSAEQIKTAISKALPLIEQSALTYTKHRQCFSCHHQALPMMALTEASKHGWDIDREKMQKLASFTAKFLKSAEKNYRKGKGQGGAADTAGYALFALEMGGWKADSTTEAVAEYLLQFSKDLDHWRTVSNRPPTEASKFTTTYLALRGLQTFGTKAQQEAIAKRKEKVRPWILKSQPKDTEDHVFRLWGLKYLQADQKELKEAATALLRQQRKDGGWAQIPNLDSDAYATGSVLVVLHQVGGLPVSDPVYQRGLDFLIKKQLKDGSWHVKSRSKPFQIYFESGFPHKDDQFISIAASSWAVAALLQAYDLPKQGENRSSLSPVSYQDTVKSNSQPAAQAPNEKPAAGSKFREGDNFYQQVKVIQKPRFQVQGLNIVSQLEYVIVSKFTIKKVHSNGQLDVEQKIESVKVQADDLTRPLVTQAAKKLQEAKFDITLNAAREVTQLQGVPESPVVAPQQILGGQGFQMASLLDRDGWKELIEATFFLPQEPLRPGSKWAKKMTHSWGPLGHWAGNALYVYAGNKGNLHRIDYGYQMQYVLPQAKAAGMPFSFANAAFQPLQAKGSILFDSDRGKVTAVEELFQVRGGVNIMLLGMNTPVFIEEEQAFSVQVFDQLPANK